MKSSMIEIAFRDGKPSSKRNRSLSRLLLTALIGAALAGCSSSLSPKGDPGPTTNPVQTYFAAGSGNLETYLIDHTANDFVTTSYNSGGGTIQASGTLSKLPNGILDLNITYLPPGQTISNPPLTGNWVVEIPGQAALMELETTSSVGSTLTFAPLAPTQSCPDVTTAENIQFVTIPKALSSSTTLATNAWNPQLETAYGSVSIATTGATVQFSNIGQHTFPAAKGGVGGTPVNPAPATATSACSPGFYGDTINVPNSVTVVNPGPQQSVPPSATIGIGPSGFLLEDSGTPQGVPDNSIPPYENVLGAGYGAIGLIKPVAALTTSTLASAQYQGILYAAGNVSSSATGSAAFKLIGSFGYPNLQTSCPTLPAPASATILYGGEFANNDPSANSFGNCDLAIDLGNQDANNNGLYPAATVYVSASFSNNHLGSAYSFPAVAVAGKIDNKYAIFLIGVDSAGSAAQPWGIYLLQAN